MGRKTTAVELLNQLLQSALTQCRPSRLLSQGLPPGPHLLAADARWSLCRWLSPGAMGSGLRTNALALLTLQSLQLTVEPQHLATQSVVLRQQRLNIAGDPLFRASA